ncbi:MAG: hypothetical protein AB7G47_10170 [Mycolicibacterium sp.]|uniref:hypothetical protein n=1 Tax=Mycolicibacterium sp. TaxID=2320850 RepID=UPI003D0FD348
MSNRHESDPSTTGRVRPWATPTRNESAGRQGNLSDIDYALAYDFIDRATPRVPYQLRFRLDPPWPQSSPWEATPRVPYQLRFRLDPPWPQSSPWESDPTGQLVAVVATPGRADTGREVAISRAGVRFLDIEAAIYGADRLPNGRATPGRPRRDPAAPERRRPEQSKPQRRGRNTPKWPRVHHGGF